MEIVAIIVGLIILAIITTLAVLLVRGHKESQICEEDRLDG